MSPEEIRELLEEHKTFHFPDTIIERELMLGLVASDDPMFLLQVPEPFRSNIISFGLKATNQWLEISSSGTVDYSEHAEKLKYLVVRFLAEVPIGKHIKWRSPNA